MVDKITVPTFEQIETILTKLATNYSNLAIVYYDVFYNPTPMDVTLQMYDESGVIQTYTIPNRAKDRANILSGEGSPQGNVEAPKGAIYQDLLNGGLYIKLTQEGVVGWTEFVTNEELRNIIIEGNGLPEGVFTADKGSLYVDKSNAGLYIKTTESGNNGWVLISANIENLANRDLSNLTATGNSKFTAKEDASNKINSIPDYNNSEVKFPTVKAVQTYLQSNTSNFADKDFSNITSVAKDYFANKDLSNITSTASSKFIGINRLRDCVMEANTLMYRGADNSFVLPAGTVILCANGLSDKNTLNNEVTTVNSDIAGVVPLIPGGHGYILYDGTYNDIKVPSDSNYYRDTEAPPITVGGVWFNPAEYTYHVVRTIDGQDHWEQVLMAEIGEWSTYNDETVETFNPYPPVKVVTTDSNELDHIVIDVGGTEDNWYRLYKDGWIEAGGYLTGGGLVSLHKEFKSTNYTLVPSANVTSFVKNRGSIGLTVTDASAETSWVAKGWSA